MNWQERIEEAAAEAQAEIKAMADQARKEIARRAAFPNRSAGQKRRYARQRDPDLYPNNIGGL